MTPIWMFVALFVLWVASGFGIWQRSAAFVRANYGFMRWWLKLANVGARRLFRLKIWIEDRPEPTPGPILVFSRHAGPGDSLLLMEGLSNDYHRRTRIVMKEFLQWDPMVDVIFNRVPSAFVPVGRKGGDPLIQAIADLAAGMGTDDAFVIFPEGGNYTRNRARRAIEKLREIGRPDLAEWAEELKNTLPPRSTGVRVALANAPENTDVVFVGHAGLETFVTAGDIWRGMPSDTEVLARVWYVPAEDVPPAEQQEDWLFDM